MNLSAIDPRKNVWIRTALIAFALLLVPVVAWLFLARAVIPHPAPILSKTEAPTAAPRSSAKLITIGRSLSGKVVDESGAAVRGAGVKFEPTAKEVGPHTTSDDKGAFFLPNAQAVDGSVIASHAGFVATRLDVSANGDQSELVLMLKKAQPLSGQVVDGDGKGVVGATVRCEPDGAVSATTVEDGHFELGVGADGCDAHAFHPEFGSSELTHLTLGGKNVIELPTPGGIAGVVIDERGQPVPVYVIAVESFVPADPMSEGMGGGSKSVNDPAGAFELTGLGRGHYTLTASAEGRPPARSDPIEVESGRTTRGVRIKLPRGLLLSGTVIDRKTKQPIAGVRVALDSVTQSGANAIKPVTTGDDGTYAIDGVPAAPFSVRFSQSSYRERILSLDGRGTSELKGDVDLAASGDGGNTEMTGIGATLGQGQQYVSITAVLPDGPAEKAGVLANDRILRIDGKSAEGFVVTDCVQRLRGPAGSSVTLTLGRGDGTVEITVTRALIVR